MAKKTTQTYNADCRTCRNGGKEINFMCHCSVLRVGRPGGARKCGYYIAR